VEGFFEGEQANKASFPKHMEKASEELQDIKSFRISLLSLALAVEFQEAGLFSSLGALTKFSLKIPNIFTSVYELTSNEHSCFLFVQRMCTISPKSV